MVDTQKLRGAIVSAGLTGEEVAKLIGITPKTFYQRMKKRVFGSDEIEVMIDVLNIEDPMSIFFAKE